MRESVLSGLNLERKKVRVFFPQQTVGDNEVSILSGYQQSGFDRTSGLHLVFLSL